MALLALTGCGEGQGQETTNTSSRGSSTASNDAPDCDAVWKDAGELPRSYRGCNAGEELVTPDTLGCSSGQRMVRYGDHFYAVLGGTIHETESSLEDDRGYRVAVASCRA